MNDCTWLASLEDLAADPGYTDAPVVGLQVDDIEANVQELAQPLVDQGFAVDLPSKISAESLDVPGLVEPDVAKPAHGGQQVAAITRWPTELTIPEGGVVMANGLTEEELAAIEEQGYRVFPTMEQAASYLWQHMGR